MTSIFLSTRINEEFTASLHDLLVDGSVTFMGRSGGVDPVERVKVEFATPSLRPTVMAALARVTGWELTEEGEGFVRLANVPPTTYKGTAYDANGRTIEDRIWGDWFPREVNGKTLEELTHAAQKLIDADPQVNSVSLYTQTQDAPGGGWRYGKHLGTVTRS
jgi:hypothetical protein